MNTPLAFKVLLGLVSGLDAPPPATPAAPPAVQAAAPDKADPIARFDELWHRRDDPAAAAELQALANDFKQSDDYDKLWRATHLYFFTSDGVENDDHKKEKLAKEGWDIGKKAIAKNPTGTAGLYWTSIDIGLYSEAVGVVNALFQGLESKFRDPLLAIKQGDPNHQNREINYIGPELTLGRYYYSLPWPKRSLSKSKKELEEAMASHPEDLRVHYYLAQTLESDGDKDGAKAQVAFIANAPIDYDPPEGRRIKRRAAAWAAAKLH